MSAAMMPKNPSIWKAFHRSAPMGLCVVAEWRVLVVERPWAIVEKMHPASGCVHGTFNAVEGIGPAHCEQPNSNPNQ